MGIHDFDLARWFMGEVQDGVGDRRDASPIRSWRRSATSTTRSPASSSTSGKLGVVDLTRSGIYGYDISTEILGLEGTLRIGYLRETPVMVMTKNNGGARHGARTSWSGSATPTRSQLQNFAQNVQQERDGADHDRDGMEALRVAWRRRRPIGRDNPYM